MSSGNILKYFIRWNYHLERHLSVFLDSCNWKFFNGNYSIKWRKKIVFEANQILSNWNPSSSRVGIQQRPSPIIAQGTPFTPCIAIYPLVEVYVGLGGCTLYMYGTPCIVCRSRWKCTIYGTNCWHSRPTEWIQCIENEPGPKGSVLCGRSWYNVHKKVHSVYNLPFRKMWKVCNVITILCTTHTVCSVNC